MLRVFHFFFEIHSFSWKNTELIHRHQCAKPRNPTGATQREGSQTQQQIKGEKKTKDDYYYLTALRLCLYRAEAAPGWGAQEPRGLSWLCWGTWPCSCQALPSSTAACCPGKQPGWNNWFIWWGAEPALMFWHWWLWNIISQPAAHGSKSTVHDGKVGTSMTQPRGSGSQLNNLSWWKIWIKGKMGGVWFGFFAWIKRKLFFILISSSFYAILAKMLCHVSRNQPF